MSRDYKIEAARAALDLVDDGMILGLGTGSTAEEFVRLLAEKVAAGLTVVGVPTSERTGALATELGISIATLADYPELDLTVDGADELDPQLRLIKGGGAAHLREKIVAVASKEMAVIADHTKKVDILGAFPLPLEIVPFGLEATQRRLKTLCRDVFGMQGNLVQRMAGDTPIVTDNGNFVLDAQFLQISDPEGLANALANTPGVVEHGLFLNIATKAFVAGPDGVETLSA